MPQRAIKLGTIYAAIGLAMSSGLLTTMLIAQSPDGPTSSFSEFAKDWGLFAAIAIWLVIWGQWRAYKQDTFIQTALVDLIRETQVMITALTDAIKAAPCGLAFDSDTIDEVKERLAKRRDRAASAIQDSDGGE